VPGVHPGPGPPPPWRPQGRRPRIAERPARSCAAPPMAPPVPSRCPAGAGADQQKERLSIVWNHPLARLADVTLNPDPSSLPGGGTLQQLTNGLGGWALILALAGLVIGAAAWALGAHSQNLPPVIRRPSCRAGLGGRRTAHRSGPHPHQFLLPHGDRPALMCAVRPGPGGG